MSQFEQNVDGDVVRQRIDDHVLTAMLNRPDAMNAIDADVLAGLDAVVRRAKTDPNVRVVVLSSAGANFCAGADLKTTGGTAGIDPDAVAAFTRRAAGVITELGALPMPVIAGIRGLVLAGGLELAMACDLVVASDTCRIGDAHANYGLLPGGGGSARLPRLVGLQLAKRMMFTGEFLDVEELRGSGLVSAIVPDDELDAHVADLAIALAGRSPLMLRAMKRLVDDALDRPLDEAVEAELTAVAEHARSRDFAEGLTAFRDRRQPAFTGT